MRERRIFKECHHVFSSSSLKCERGSPMYLKRLEISGFKSFANKTVLDFSSSYGGYFGTRVSQLSSDRMVRVNPISPMLFVLRSVSSRPRILRGKKSEDVIFAGTEGKSRMGSAAVTLHFDNSDQRIPIEFSEVSDYPKDTSEWRRRIPDQRQ
jgi:chromosome segregation protein